MRRPPSTVVASAFLLNWVGYFSALQWSVVRFELGIVVVLTSATILLATGLARRWCYPLPAPLVAGALLVCAVVAEVVPFFTYTSTTERRWLAHGLALTCLLVAGLLTLLRTPHRGSLALAAAVTGSFAVSAAAVRLDPAPRIDVWVTLQQAADGMAAGQNIYQMRWVDSPGIQDAFTYLPWTAVLLAPGRWIAGDVRWALLVAFVVGLACMVALGARGSARTSSMAIGASILLVLAPGTLTQAEQAWTEPLLFACLAGWALLVARGRAWWAVIPLALACASKQHMALLLPILACWQAFGLRRTVATGGLTGALIAPWFFASPTDFVHDTITLLIGFHPIRFANTLFIAAQTELGWTPPFWLTGIIVLGALAVACVLVWRRQPPLHELLRWLALVLLVANLVNKQAFYNQYWLAGALVALSLAATPAFSGDHAIPAHHRGPPVPELHDHDRVGGHHREVGGAFAAAASADRLIGQQPLQSQRQVVPAPVLSNPFAATDAKALPQLGIKQ